MPTSQGRDVARRPSRGQFAAERSGAVVSGSASPDDDGDFAGRWRKFRDIVRRTPEDDKSQRVRRSGPGLREEREAERGRRELPEATRRQPQNPAAWLRLAILYGRQMDHASGGCVRRGRAAVSQPEHLEGVTEVLYQRAVLANRFGKSSEAQAQLQQAIEDVPQHRQPAPADSGAAPVEQHGAPMNGAKAQDYATEAIDLARATAWRTLLRAG